jgi:hypothetical protein
MEIFKGLLNYLKDWKNWLTHGLIGVAILVVALVIPVEPIYRVLLLLLVVGFNIIRMRYAKKHLSPKEE